MRNGLCLLLLAALSHSQTAPNQSALLKKGQAEAAKADYAHAETDLKASLATAKANQDAEGERQADLQLSILFEKQNQLEVAEQYLKSIVATWHEMPPGVHCIPSLITLHTFYALHMLWAKDVKTLKMILAINSTAHPDSTLNGVYSIQLAESLVKTKDYPAAETYVRSGLSILNKAAVPASSYQITHAKELLRQILKSEGISK